MPLKGEAKLAYQRAWRKRSIKNGYGKWLYARRKARFRDAEEFGQALQFIAAGNYGGASEVAAIVLAKSTKRHEDLGTPPNGSPAPGSDYEHPGIWLTEVLAKRGLQ